MRCLLVHDIQNDFFQNGSLPCLKHEYVDKLNKFLKTSGKKFDVIVATQDYHKPQHHAFASNNPGKKVDDTIELHHDRQILWPDHCVQNTPGASFHPGLDVFYFSYIVRKGTNPMYDTGSGFFDKSKGQKTVLDEFLKFKSTEEIFILGNAVDLGITQTATDGLELDYKIRIVTDMCSNFSLSKDKETIRWERLKEGGVMLVTSDALGLP